MYAMSDMRMHAMCVPPPLQFLKEAGHSDVSSGWEGDEGSSYEGDFICDVAPEMVVVKTEGFAIRGGLYKRVPGCVYNSQCVWCNGTWRLYGGKKGYWMLAECEEDMVAQRGYLRSTDPHDGVDPSKCTTWQLHTSDGWKDCEVSISTLFFGLGCDETTEDLAEASLSTSSCSSSASSVDCPPVLRKPTPLPAVVDALDFPVLEPLQGLSEPITAPVPQPLDISPKANTIFSFLKKRQKKNPVADPVVEAGCYAGSCFMM